MIGTVAMIGGFPLVWETSRKAQESNTGRGLAKAALVVLAVELLVGTAYALVSFLGIQPWRS